MSETGKLGSVSKAPGGTRILGLDPGTRVAGYGVVELTPDGRVRAVAVGAWDLRSQGTLPARLCSLAVEFRRVVAAYAPDCVCVELPFVAANSRSALVLGAARGVLLAEAHAHGLAISEINATSAKKIVTGDGYADKAKVARSLAALLGVDFGSLPSDATDALAIAYAQVFRSKASAIAAGPAKGARRNRNLPLEEWTSSRKRQKKSSWEALLNARAVAKT